MNEQSGSRGEANFVWKCKNCKVKPSGHKTRDISLTVRRLKRESNATIKAAPAVYEQSSPARPKNLIEIDCRGLEFTDFKPDVCLVFDILQGFLEVLTTT
jgi:hypothetical protein